MEMEQAEYGSDSSSDDNNKCIIKPEIIHVNEDVLSDISTSNRNDSFAIDLETVKKELHSDLEDTTAPVLKNETDTCRFCLEQFTDPSELKFHEIRHQEDYLVNGLPSVSDSDITDGYKTEHFNIKKEIPVSDSEELNDVPSQTSTSKQTSRKPLICSYCNNTFRRKYELDSHVLASHKEQIKDITQEISCKIHQCKHCDYKTIRNGDLKRHILKHTDVPVFSCQFCGRGFNRRIYLDAHLLNEHKESDNIKKSIVSKIHSCSVCDFETVRFDEYQRHLARHNGTNKTMQTAIAKQTPPKRWICSYCNNRFRRKYELDSHVLASHKEQIKDIQQEISCKIHQCEHCDYKTIRNGDFHRHILKHKGVPSFTCQFCGKGFNRRLYFDAHLLNEHKESGGNIKESIVSKIHNCSVCEFETVRIDDYQRHLACHTETSKTLIKSKCDMCDFSSYNQRSVKEHMRTHCEEKRLQCRFCAKGFNQRHHLYSHILANHKHQIENLDDVIKHKIHKCLKCAYVSMHWGQYRRHLASHGDVTDLEIFQCEQCGYSTNKKGSLIKHMIIHSNVRKYSCNECDRGFNYKYNYDSHVLSKHGDNVEMMSAVTSKYYECSECSYKNVKPGMMEIHMKHKHSAQ